MTPLLQNWIIPGAIFLVGLIGLLFIIFKRLPKIAAYKPTEAVIEKTKSNRPGVKQHLQSRWEKVRTVTKGAFSGLTRGIKGKQHSSLPVELAPTDDPKMLAQQAAQSGQNKDAERMFVEAIKRNPADLEAYRGLGLLYMDAGNIVDAKAAFEFILTKDPKNVSALSNLGLLFFNEGDMTVALRYFHDAAMHDKDNPDRYAQLAMAYAADNNAKRALQFYEKAVRLDPTREGLWLELGRLALSERDTATARQAYTEILKINPTSQEAQQRLAEI